MSVLDTIRGFHAELTAIRQDIHAHPEIGFTEHRTSDIVAAKLAEWGIEVHRNVGGTGVVGVLRKGNGAASIGLRCDMDALPITEATGLPYASKNPGVMHACGHDGHTAMLLGTARYLAQHGTFAGTVNFIFQPAEEGLGGALAMLKDDLFARFPCESVYGLHNWPSLPVGHFAIRPGPAMAGGGFFDITITGRGAHGAMPHMGVDPVVVAAGIINATQSIVARNVVPTDPAVVSITMVHAGAAYNVIPETCVLSGTARAYSTETLKLIESRMREIATGVAAAHGATAELDFRILFAPLVNEAQATVEYADAAARLVGGEQVTRDYRQVSGSEDFSFMLEACPGAYIFMGNGETSSPVHHPLYNFNDEAIPYGAGVMAELVETKLAPKPL